MVALSLLILGLILPTLTTAAAPASGPAALGKLPTTAPSLSPARPAALATHPQTSGECARSAAGWTQLDAVDPAPNVASALQSPCVLGHDVPALYFVSNVTGSGSDVRYFVALPPNGTSPASALSAFWVGMWVSGVPCSYGGASYLTVELLPPYVAQAGVAGSPYWTVRAPVWDLVPAGSCDSQCQNDTAFFTISARSFCEDDAVLSGMGNLTDVAGGFHPGDLLTIDLSGTPSGPGPLSVAINDSTDATRDLAWNYAGVSRIVGTGLLTPLYSTASTLSGGWTGGLDVGFGWQNCPLPLAGSSFPTPCDSYDGPVVNISGAPALDGVASWNATTHSFANRYPSVATQSSSGACSGLPAAAPCADFTTYGGTGAYPSFSVQSDHGVAWYDYGPNSALERTRFGGGSLEFPSNGNLSSLHDPTTVAPPSTTVGSNSVTFTVRASDPNGVAAVTVGTWWCTRNSTRSPLSFPAGLSLMAPNTSHDGNWTVIVPTGAAGMSGPLYYSIRARSDTGATTAPLNGQLTLSGGGGSCGLLDPAKPGLVLGGISPVGGGYQVGWSDNSSSGVANFTVQAHPAAGGTTVAYFVGNATNARITGLAGNASYDISVIATNPGGLFAPSTAIAAGKTFFPLTGRAPNVTASAVWVNQTTVRISSNATGGSPPFDFAFAFGDGTNATVFTTSDEASTVHFYGRNYSGDAVVSVRITDTYGDSAIAPVVVVPILATPLSVSATVAGGHDFVGVSWSAPRLPAVNASAFAVTSYTVFWTTDPAAAPYLSTGWPSNATLPEVNVTDAGMKMYASLAVPDGQRVYAQVVAWNKYGEGLLPNETGPGVEPVLTGLAGPFSSGPIGSDPGVGGPAPFLDNFSTPLTTAEGTAVTNATYRFSGGAFVLATVTGGDGQFWANASYTFVHPGLINVYLYALDSVSELVVASTTVLVSPGDAPIVHVGVAPSPIFVNSSLALSAFAAGGSGRYNYSWDLGDGTGAVGGNLTYSYTAAATYIVTLTVTDTFYGGVTVETVPVTVLPLPTVAIASSANGGPGTYRLAAIVSNGYGNISYTWLFDDGTQGTGAVVNHTWVAGTYAVTLEAKDAYGHHPTSTTIVVVGAPTTVIQTPSGEVAAWVAYALLAAVVVLAVLSLLLILRSRRAPPPEPGEPMYGDPEGPGAEDPMSEGTYDEEAPRGL